MASLKRKRGVFYLQHYAGKKQKRICLHTTSWQIANEKRRQFESAEFAGIDNPLPTRTPVDQILEKYVRYIEASKTAKSTQTREKLVM